MGSSSFPINPTSQTTLDSTEEVPVSLQDQLAETLEDIEGPDDVAVITKERFFEILNQLFSDIPFVALNTSRSRCIEKTSDGAARGAASVVAVGFEAENTSDIIQLLQDATGVEGMTLSAEDDTIKQLLHDTFVGNPSFVQHDLPKDDTQETPIEPVQARTILAF